MSELTFDCPHCSKSIACDGIHSGDKFDCPACGKPLTVPPRSEWWQRAAKAEAGGSSQPLPVAEKGLGFGDFLGKALRIILVVIGLALVVLAILFGGCLLILSNAHGL